MRHKKYNRYVYAYETKSDPFDCFIVSWFSILLFLKFVCVLLNIEFGSNYVRKNDDQQRLVVACSQCVSSMRSQHSLNERSIEISTNIERCFIVYFLLSHLVRTRVSPLYLLIKGRMALFYTVTLLLIAKANIRFSLRSSSNKGCIENSWVRLIIKTTSIEV